MEITENPTKVTLWISYVLQAIIALFFLMGAAMNLLQTETAVANAEELGYDTNSLHYMGAALLLATCIYVIPRFIVLGAILLTGWLGGAVATHVIHQDPIGVVLIPVLFAMLVWLVVVLRNKSYHILLPL
ncbi:MAG: DoxX family protein [Nonlabens sp.]|nr:DoxX family protein [Nonlabens sp.]